MAWKTHTDKKKFPSVRGITAVKASGERKKGFFPIRPCILNSDPRISTTMGLLHCGSQHTNETVSFLSKEFPNGSHTLELSSQSRSAPTAEASERHSGSFTEESLNAEGVRSISEEWARLSFWIAEIFVNTSMTTLWFYRNCSWGTPVPSLDMGEKAGVWPICTGNRQAVKTSFFSPAVLDSAIFFSSFSWVDNSEWIQPHLAAL